MSSNCTLHHLWLVTVTCKERKSTPMITSACATALAGLNSTKQSSSGSVDLPGARFRGGNEYAGMYPAKMSTMVHIFADGARICAPVHVYAGGTNTLLHRQGQGSFGERQPSQNHRVRPNSNRLTTVFFFETVIDLIDHEGTR